MKYLILLILFLPLTVQAEERICKGYDIVKSDAFNWVESDFNEKTAEESMSNLHNALETKGRINSCGLHNSLEKVKGYILKQRARYALEAKSVPEVMKKYEVSVFCEFLQHSKPCE